MTITIRVPDGTLSGEYTLSPVAPLPIPEVPPVVVTPPPAPVIAPLAAGDEGVDVSRHNGLVDYGRVKASGKRVLIIRMTLGETGVDDMGSLNYRNGTAAGFDYIGPYHLGIRGTDPARNVQNVLRYSFEGNYRLTFDLEPLSHEINDYNNRGRHTPPALASANAVNMQRTLFALADMLEYLPIVYTNEYALTVLGMQNSDWLAEFPGHFAAYNSAKKVSVPGPWKRKANSEWYCHQYDAGDQTWSVPVDGFPGRADRNVYSGLVLK